MARVYAPAMPRSVFQRKRPQGSYQAYLNYLQRQRGPTWNVAKAYQTQRIPSPVRGRLPTYESMLRGLSFQSPAQMEAQANRMTQQNLAGQQALIQGDYNDRMKTALAQELAAQAAGRAASAMNAQLIGLVGSGYSDAAANQRALGGSLGAAMAGATAADVAAANASAANVGAPAISVGGPVGSGGVAGPAQQGVETYRGAELPAQAMGTAGTAAETGMFGLINAGNLRATQEAIAGYNQARMDADQARSSAIRELAAGRGATASDYLMKLQDAQRQQYALAMSLLEGRRATGEQIFQHGETIRAGKRAQQGINQQGTQIRNQASQWAAEQAQHAKEWNASNKLAQQQAARTGRSVDEAGSIARGYWVDANGNFITKNGKKIPVPKTVQQKSAGPTIRQQMAQDAQNWLYRVRSRTGAPAATKAQLVAYLNALYPGNPQIAKAIADSIYPGKGPSIGGGGTIGSQPGTK